MFCDLRLLLIYVILFIGLDTISAQSCSCTVSQVQANTVTPCDWVVGTIVNVNSATSFRNAINQANANGGNMTILVADGTYEIASPVSYPYVTASNLVIRSASGNRDNVILHGEGMKDVAPNTEDGLHIAGDYVTIADITIKDVGNHGIQVSGHHLWIHNVRIQNTYQQMLKGATAASSIDSAVVQCSLFEYTDATGPNFYIGGLDIHKGNGWIVRDNVFRNIISPSGSVAEHAIHFWNNSQNNTIERNMIINCDRGIGFGLGTSPNTGGIIRNNMIYNNGAGAFNDVGIGLESSPGTKVYNNTIFISYQNAIEYRFTSTTGVSIINNLTNKLIRSRDGGTGLVESNMDQAQHSWFVNPAAGDLHLASLIDIGGITLSDEVPDDIDQTPRFVGPNFEMGADEFLSTSIYTSFMDDELKIFPNPGSGIFNITGFGKDILPANFEVIDAIGKRIKIKMRFLDNSCEIDLMDSPDGIYLVKYRKTDKSYFRKLIMCRN